MKYQVSFCPKTDFFTCENNMLSSHMKILYCYYGYLLIAPFPGRVKWFGFPLVFNI